MWLDIDEWSFINIHSSFSPQATFHRWFETQPWYFVFIVIRFPYFVCLFVHLFFRVGVFCAIISIDHTELQKYVSVLLFDFLTFDWLLVLFSWIMGWRGLQSDPSLRVFGYFFNNPFFSWLFKSKQTMNSAQAPVQILFYFSWEGHKHKEHLIRHNRQKIYLFFWMIYSPVSSFVVAEKKEELK